ncbi:MAG: hypothetical protein H7319_14855 [Spirosoma sp.]|nr:hypothetical protein [Spirosoma sp.]
MNNHRQFILGFVFLLCLTYLSGCSGCSRSGSHQPRRSKPTPQSQTIVATDSRQRR